MIAKLGGPHGSRPVWDCETLFIVGRILVWNNLVESFHVQKNPPDTQKIVVRHHKS